MGAGKESDWEGVHQGDSGAGNEKGWGSGRRKEAFDPSSASVLPSLAVPPNQTHACKEHVRPSGFIQLRVQKPNGCLPYRQPTPPYNLPSSRSFIHLASPKAILHA
jgi:hypothetical protein